MREIRSYGSVGERGGNEPRYPEPDAWMHDFVVYSSLLSIISIILLVSLAFIRIFASA